MTHIKLIYLAIGLLLCHASQAYAETKYYKCVTESGTTFSQFPCAGNATSHTISTTDPSVSTPKNYSKQLNQLEREQIIRNLDAEIRANKYKLDILSRDRDKAYYQQEQRLKRVLSDREIKQINKDIKKQLKAIDKQYARDLKSLNKKIANLEKKRDRYN